MAQQTSPDCLGDAGMCPGPCGAFWGSFPVFFPPLPCLDCPLLVGCLVLSKVIGISLLMTLFCRPFGPSEAPSGGPAITSQIAIPPSLGCIYHGNLSNFFVSTNFVHTRVIYLWKSLINGWKRLGFNTFHDTILVEFCEVISTFVSIFSLHDVFCLSFSSIYIYIYICMYIYIYIFTYVYIYTYIYT